MENIGAVAQLVNTPIVFFGRPDSQRNLWEAVPKLSRAWSIDLTIGRITHVTFVVIVIPD